MKTALRIGVLSIVMLAAVASAVWAQSPVRRVASSDDNPASGIITLFAHDPLAHTFSFGEGAYGGVFQDNMAKNRASDIDFGNYHRGEFTVGVEGGREGTILDLGAVADVARRNGFAETVGGGQGFASIRINDGKVLILKDYETQATQELSESAKLFSTPTSASSHAPVKLGHIYLLRITDRHDATFERIVKLLVIGHIEGQSVTLRWEAI